MNIEKKYVIAGVELTWAEMCALHSQIRQEFDHLLPRIPSKFRFLMQRPDLPHLKPDYFERLEENSYSQVS